MNLKAFGGKPAGLASTMVQVHARRIMSTTAGLRALAPRCGRSWWLDRVVPEFDASVTPERHVTGPVLAEIQARFGVRPPGVAIVGTSMEIGRAHV